MTGPESTTTSEAAPAPDGAPDGVPTLYEWAGGMPAFERLTDVFYGRVRQDPILAPVFAHMSPEHATRVAHFIAEVFGGPPAYSAERGGHPTMVRQHLGRGLTEAPAGCSCSGSARTRPGSPPIRSSAPPSWPTSSGAPASR